MDERLLKGLLDRTALDPVVYSATIDPILLPLQVERLGIFCHFVDAKKMIGGAKYSVLVLAN